MRANQISEAYLKLEHESNEFNVVSRRHQVVEATQHIGVHQLHPFKTLVHLLCCEGLTAFLFLLLEEVVQSLV